VLVEALKNLTLIDKSECHLVVLPPLFKNFSGAPCRAMAILED
jgi:kynurenine formamidase